MSIVSKKKSYLLRVIFIVFGLLTFGDVASAQTAAQDCERLSGDLFIAACGLAIQQNPQYTNAFSNRGNAWSDKGDNFEIRRFVDQKSRESML